VQFESAAAVFAVSFGGDEWGVEDMRQHPNGSQTTSILEQKFNSVN
jgi:hypothetical protein